MKTQVVQLDTHDDIISTRDKLGWKQTGRVLLIWPRKGRILTRRFDLVLLARHSASLGAQLALVTSDPEVKANAHSLGISVFKDPQDAQRSRWDRPYHWRRRITRSSNPLPELEAKRLAARPTYPALLGKPVVRLLFFSVGVLAVLAVMVVLLPGATVTITPQVESQTLEVKVQASPAISQINLSGLLPVLTEQIVVEGRDQMAATGQTSLPAAPATGEVVFRNLTSEPVNIPKGTIVRTLSAEPIRFATTRSGQLAAGADARLTLPVRALVPGAASNLGSGRLTAVEGMLGLDIEVSNANPLRGGTNQIITTPSEGDQRALYERLLASLTATAKEEFETHRAAGDLLLSPDPVVSEILEQEYFPAAGTPTDTLDLQLRVAFDFYTVPSAMLEEFSRTVLDANLPEGFAPSGDAIQIDHLTSPVLAADQAREWKIRLTRPIQRLPVTQLAALMVNGLRPEEAGILLKETLKLDVQPDIQLIPSWWPRLPYLPFRIHFQFKEPTAQ